MFKYNVADMTTIICVDKISAIAVEFLTGALYMVSHHTHTHTIQRQKHYLFNFNYTVMIQD
jgi:hypothetical protein